MCFGVRHAPLIFHKTLRLGMKLIREKLEVRSVSYSDDLIFLCLDREKLETKKFNFLPDSLRIRLEDLGRQILPLTNLRNRIPRMVDQLNTHSDNDIELQKLEDVKSVWKMDKNNSAKDLVKVKFLASFIGQLNFLRHQIKGWSLHMKKLNNMKQNAAIIRGWNSNMYPCKITLSEVFL
ncbi:MAG: hypothetical protein EZS28_019665 [Streblomastix strix]|uniref:Reverse transcriptase domain-containing protein n=1 Tax=Streblomastix strix TaxID=222440 RepID=A0A5J4VQ82_9EUKA|nr:MAG: hypothetical protein EZS28_019665 [Streblomastix strix]